MVLSGRGVDAQEVARLLKSAASMAYSGGSAEDCLAGALNLVCDFTGWPLGHVYLVERKTMELVPTDIWRNDDPARFAPFVEATTQTRLAMGVGLAGRILSTSGPVRIVDPGADPNFPRGTAALGSGIGVAFGFPIVSTLGVEGVLEFFASQPAELDDSLLDLLSHIGLVLGHALDRGRALDALAASEARLAEAERLGHMGAWLYRVDQDLLDWSAELCALYGLDPTSTPTTFDEYLSRVHPDDLESVKRAITATIETGRAFEHEYRLVFRPGEIRWAHSRGEVVARDEGGRSLRLAGYCQDITDRKLREEAIRTGQERLAEAERIAHLGSWSWDVATDSVSWSDELVRIYGLDQGSSPTTFEAYLDSVHPDDRERVREAVMRTARTREPFEHDYRIVRPGGEQRWVHARGEVAEEAGGVATRFAGYCHDITERRLAAEERDRLERQLHQSQRLESLGQLAGGVAHDFNNLLAVILSYSGFVDEELTGAGFASDQRLEAVRGDVEQIRRAAGRAAELTRQLLAFGRREVVRPRILALDAVVRDVEQLLRRTIGRQVELRASHPPDLWKVLADPGQIEQVLANLAVNARDAMPAGGTLTIETANIVVDADSAAMWPGIVPGRHVRLRVSDTGQGMPREVAERAFEPFFTTKPRGEGSGLGLATVHGIIAQAGGSVRIDSQPGVGTTIAALLPAIDHGRAVEVEPSRTRRKHRAGGETVLVVEDDDAMREVTGRMLARHGYKVIAATSGAEAIEAARRHGSAIRLLVTDVVMPQMGGTEVADRIGALIPGLRVLYTSGHAQPVLASRGTLDPGVVLVEKPFTEAELLDALGEVMDAPEDAGEPPAGPGS